MTGAASPTCVARRRSPTTSNASPTSRRCRHQRLVNHHRHLLARGPSRSATVYDKDVVSVPHEQAGEARARGHGPRSQAAARAPMSARCWPAGARLGAQDRQRRSGAPPWARSPRHLVDRPWGSGGTEAGGSTPLPPSMSAAARPGETGVPRRCDPRLRYGPQARHPWNSQAIVIHHGGDAAERRLHGGGFRRATPAAPGRTHHLERTRPRPTRTGHRRRGPAELEQGPAHRRVRVRMHLEGDGLCGQIAPTCGSRERAGTPSVKLICRRCLSGLVPAKWPLRGARRRGGLSPRTAQTPAEAA